MFENLRRDYPRYGATGWRTAWLLFLRPGSWACTAYRFDRWSRLSRMPFVVRIPIRLVSRLYSLAIQVMTHIEISWEAQVGPGLYLPHAGCVMVTPGAVLGENVTIAPNAVIGPSFESEESASAPHVADRVYLAPGAKVLGAVEVGEDALIGANAVVMKSVPARAVVMGNPGRTVAKTGCFNVISYPGMENDPGRQKSLAEGGLGPDGKPLESPASEAASD